MKKCSKCKKLLDESNFYKYKSHKDGLKFYCKKCVKAYNRIHSVSKEKRKQYRIKYRKHDREYQREYRKGKLRLRDKLGTRIYLALKRKTKKAEKTTKLVGCSIEFLKQHLQKYFKKGMAWDNYGKWHIDHIRPCCSFNLSKVSEQRKCFHYTNLQPLWAKENWSKSGKSLK